MISKPTIKPFPLRMLQSDYEIVLKAAIKEKRKVNNFINKHIVDKAKEVLLE